MLRESTTHSPDSAFVAILDWTILGRYTGARQSEWCQVSGTKYKRIEVWPNTPPEAFILSDFVFLDTNKRHMTITSPKGCIIRSYQMEETEEWR